MCWERDDFLVKKCFFANPAFHFKGAGVGNGLKKFDTHLLPKHFFSCVLCFSKNVSRTIETNGPEKCDTQFPRFPKLGIPLVSLTKLRFCPKK